MAILEGPPVGLGAGVYDPTEVLAEIPGATEAAALRYCFDREIAYFEKLLGEMDALALQPLVGGGSGGSEKPPRE